MISGAHPTSPDPHASEPTTGTSNTAQPIRHEDAEAVSTPPAATPTAPRRWSRGVLRGRRALATGVTVAALAIGGAGFGVGYAVGGDGAPATQQVPDFDRGRDGFGGPPDGMRDFPGGPMDGQTDGGTGPGSGGTGQAPDFDGDGQPDPTDPDEGTTQDDDSSDAAQDSTQQG